MKKIVNKNLVLLLILLAGALGGAVGVFIKLAVKEMPPFAFTTLRLICALLILLPALYLTKQKLSFQKFKGAILPSLFGAGNIIFFVLGIKWTTASSAQMLYTMSPMIAGIISYFLFKERLSRFKIAGIVIGFSGTLLIILLPVFAGTSHLNMSIIGNLLVFCAVLSNCLYTITSKKLQKNYPPLILTTAFVITTLLLQIPLLLSDWHSNIYSLQNLPSVAIWSILYVGIAGTGLFFIVLQYAIKHAGATIANMTLYVEPVFTIILAVLLLSEKISLGFVLGAILIFLGVIFATYNKKETNVRI